MVSDLNMSHGKMSNFVSFPLFGFAFVRKLRNFDVKGHLILFETFRCCCQTVPDLVYTSLFE